MNLELVEDGLGCRVPGPEVQAREDLSDNDWLHSVLLNSGDSFGDKKKISGWNVLSR